MRAPAAVRPWQHVLEPLRGYLDLAERLTLEPDGFDEGWNFGPGSAAERPVLQVAEALAGAGVDIERKSIKLEDDSIRDLGSYTAKVKLHKEVIAEVSFEVVAE